MKVLPMKISGTWHIDEMEQWDADYFNMEQQAYITIDHDGHGDFQFGLVVGAIDGKAVLGDETERIEFSWQGADECDETWGRGWIAIKSADIAEGEFELEGGDTSTFLAHRA